MAAPFNVYPKGLKPVLITTTIATDPITFNISAALVGHPYFLIFGMMYTVNGEKQFWRADHHVMRLARVQTAVSANSVAQFPFELGWDVPFEWTTLLQAGTTYNFWDLTGIDGLEPTGGLVTMFIMPYNV